MPMFFSRNHGGISRSEVFSLMLLAQGRASWYVINDIGPIDPGRWQPWQERCRIGAMCFVNVTRVASVCAAATPGAASMPALTRPATPIRADADQERLMLSVITTASAYTRGRTATSPV